MTARIRVFWKISLALLAVTALSGCVHHEGAMTDHHRHHMAKQHASLAELVDTMNAAEGDAKVDAVAAVVNELVDQHMRAHEPRHDAHAAGDCGCPACPYASGSCSMD